jgi:RNA polymerase sigma-70 factor (ECF subfamily)
VRADRARRLLAALATLPAEQRAALVLVDMHGIPVEEAAAILEVPTGTVKSRCSRGRARLLPLVEGLHDADHEGNRVSPQRVTAADGGDQS